MRSAGSTRRRAAYHHAFALDPTRGMGVEQPVLPGVPASGSLEEAERSARPRAAVADIGRRRTTTSG